ncbi:Protein FAN [Pelomyxa schiedti]|nr:Protein FAN [Pelomyxa schiedti]
MLGHTTPNPPARAKTPPPVATSRPTPPPIIQSSPPPSFPPPPPPSHRRGTSPPGATDSPISPSTNTLRPPTLPPRPITPPPPRPTTPPPPRRAVSPPQPHAHSHSQSLSISQPQSQAQSQPALWSCSEAQSIMHDKFAQVSMSLHPQRPQPQTPAPNPICSHSNPEDHPNEATEVVEDLRPPPVIITAPKATRPPTCQKLNVNQVGTSDSEESQGTTICSDSLIRGDGQEEHSGASTQEGGMVTAPTPTPLVYEVANEESSCTLIPLEDIVFLPHWSPIATLRFKACATLSGHTAPVQCCCIVPGGSKAITGSRDKTLRVWNLKTLSAERVLTGHTKEVTCCCATRDGSILISGSLDHTVRVWHVDSGIALNVIEGHAGAINSCCFVTDTLLATGSDDRSVKLWSVGDWSLLHSHEANREVLCCCASNENVFYGSKDKKLVMLSSQVDTPTQFAKCGPKDVVCCCSMTPDLSRIVVGYEDKSLNIFQCDSGTLLHTLKFHSREITGCCSSKDILVSSSLDGTTIISLHDGTPLQVLKHSATSVFCCCVNEDPEILILTGGEKSVYIWKPGTVDMDEECNEKPKKLFESPCTLYWSNLQSNKGVLFISAKDVLFVPDPGSSHNTCGKARRWFVDGISGVDIFKYLGGTALKLSFVEGPSALFHMPKTLALKLVNVFASLKPRNLTHIESKLPEDVLRNSDLTRDWQQVGLMTGWTGTQFFLGVGISLLADYESSSINLSDPTIYRDLSKPIGALNQKRLSNFLERYQDLLREDIVPFLYGSLYSNPTIVCYYLMRVEPYHSFCLHQGNGSRIVPHRPDSTFWSIDLCWKSCLHDNHMLNELIPQFFCDPQFLLNKHHFPLGTRRDWSPVNDVVLPPWAHSPSHFIKLNREALESEYVSQHLHEWIDLIFGYKQRGEEALRSHNVFFHTFYGDIDASLIEDPLLEKASIEAQLVTSGQIPFQLLRKPHPSRNPPSSSITRSVLPTRAFKSEFSEASQDISARYLLLSALAANQLENAPLYKHFILPVQGVPSPLYCNLRIRSLNDKVFTTVEKHKQISLTVSEIGITALKKKLPFQEISIFIPLADKCLLSVTDSKLYIKNPDTDITYCISKLESVSPSSLLGCLKIWVMEPSAIISKIIHGLKYLIETRCCIDPRLVKNLEFVTKGGHGEIWKGLLGTSEVALKKIRADKFEDSFVRHEFLREFALLRDLKNEPYVLQLFGLCINPLNSPGIFMITEWCPCGSLNQVIFDSSYRPVLETAVVIMKHICLGMQAIHSKSIIHRDLKPENVLVFSKETWDLKIADFGLSGQFERTGQTVTKGICGTEEYCAPEQWDAHHTQSVDVFAFGLMAIEIMLGERLSAKLRQTHPRVHPAVWKSSLKDYFTLPEQWPEGIRHMIRACCVLDPVARPTFQGIMSILSRVEW